MWRLVSKTLDLPHNPYTYITMYSNDYYQKALDAYNLEVARRKALPNVKKYEKHGIFKYINLAKLPLFGEIFQFNKEVVAPSFGIVISYTYPGNNESIICKPDTIEVTKLHQAITLANAHLGISNRDYSSKLYKE